MITLRLNASILTVFIIFASQVSSLYAEELLSSPHAKYTATADSALPHHEIIDAAWKGIRTLFTDAGAQERNELCGQQEVGDPKLGKGFQVYAVSPDDLLNSSISQDLNSLAVPAGMWHFLILNRDKAICLLIVAQMNGEWVAVGIGGSVLASQLGRMTEAWPGDRGYDYKFIKIYATTSDFVGLLQRETVVGVVPLSSARIAMSLPNQDFDAQDILDSKNVIETMKQILKRNTQNDYHFN